MLSSAQPLNHIYVTMSKQTHTCTLWVQGSSILMVQGLIQKTKIEAAKTVSHFATTPMMGGALGRTVSRGDSFIVRASCSADPDKRVHSILVMDPGFPVCGGGGGGGGEQMTHAHVLLQLGYGGDK